MKRYQAKGKGPAGTYLNISGGEFVHIDEGEALPGKNDERYIKVPSVLAVVTGPFAGLAFVIYLPMVGIIGAVAFIGYQLWKVMLKVTGQAAGATRPNLEPEKAFPVRNGKDTTGEKDV